CRFFFFQAEDGIRDFHVTGVQTCALPILEARMTICNMSIEAGARAGMIAPDETTFAYLKGRPHAPEGADWDAAVEHWRTLRTDDDAVFDAEVTLRASDLEPFATWGTNPGQGQPISASLPVREVIAD